jgi:SAM-dependent methyltransferase
LPAELDFHRGLAARLFDALNDDGAEVGYFRRLIGRSGQPALDAGCGPGRLLLRYLEAGLDVEGSDISPDMLELCRRHGAERGLSPVLHLASAAELDLPRRYRTIFMCGAFALNGTHADDVAALDRAFRQLEPGGTLAVDCEAGWSMRRSWLRCVDPDRDQPGEWWDSEPTALPNGEQIAVRGRMLEADPVGQSSRKQLEYRLIRDGRTVETETHLLVERWYGARELTAMLEAAGFADVVVHGDYAEQPLRAAHMMQVYVAVRPA